MKHFHLLVLLTLLVGLVSHSHVRTKTFRDAIPLSYKTVATNSKQVIIKAPREFDELKVNSNRSSRITGEFQEKFAFPVKTNLKLTAVATKTKSEKSSTTFSLTVKAKDALNLSIIFDKFILSTNSILKIFNDHELTDSITANENNDFNRWATRLYWMRVNFYTQQIDTKVII